MEKLIHERLRESLGKLDDCCNISSEIINHLRSDLGLTEDQKSYANDLRNIINYIADQVEKYYIPRPRFDDGEPLQLGDKCYIHGTRSFQIVRSIALVESGYRINGHKQRYRPLMRQEPIVDADGVEIKVGDTVWVKGDVNKAKVEEVHKDRVWVKWNDGWTADVYIGDVSHREPDSLENHRNYGA